MMLDPFCFKRWMFSDEDSFISAIRLSAFVRKVEEKVEEGWLLFDLCEGLRKPQYRVDKNNNLFDSEWVIFGHVRDNENRIVLYETDVDSYIDAIKLINPKDLVSGRDVIEEINKDGCA